MNIENPLLSGLDGQIQDYIKVNDPTDTYQSIMKIFDELLDKEDLMAESSKLKKGKGFNFFRNKILQKISITPSSELIKIRQTIFLCLKDTIPLTRISEQIKESCFPSEKPNNETISPAKIVFVPIVPIRMNNTKNAGVIASKIPLVTEEEEHINNVLLQDLFTAIQSYNIQKLKNTEEPLITILNLYDELEETTVLQKDDPLYIIKDSLKKCKQKDVAINRIIETAVNALFTSMLPEIEEPFNIISYATKKNIPISSSMSREEMEKEVISYVLKKYFSKKDGKRNYILNHSCDELQEDTFPIIHFLLQSGFQQEEIKNIFEDNLHYCPVNLKER